MKHEVEENKDSTYGSIHSENKEIVYITITIEKELNLQINRNMKTNIGATRLFKTFLSLNIYHNRMNIL